MNPNNPKLVSSSPNPQVWFRLLCLTAGRAGKLAACLLLMGIATLWQSASAQPLFNQAVLADNPVAFWQLNEDAGSTIAVDSSPNGLNATYGTTTTFGYANGVFSPQPPTSGLPDDYYGGFTNFQGAAQTTAGAASSAILLPSLNLYTNTVTVCMWINPAGAQVASVGLLADRTSTDASIVGFGTTLVNGMPNLGYTWNNNSAATWSWNSQLFPQVGIYSFVAWVMNTNGTTIYLYYVDTNGNTQLQSAFNGITNAAEAFSVGTTCLGSDAAAGGGPDGTRVFNGDISSAAVFNHALSQQDVLALFAAGQGVAGYAPQITTQPNTTYVFAGNSAQMSASGINGSQPFTYQWTLNGTNVQNIFSGTNYIGANSNVLTIATVTTNFVGTYQLAVSNSVGGVFSSNALLAIKTPTLVGEWLNGSAAATNSSGAFVDVSGYSLATNHGVYLVGAGNVTLVNDAPPGKTGYSAIFNDGASGLAISNSSTLDASYDTTFDGQIDNAFTVSCWGKGWPGTWNPFMSKWGEAGPEGGWQLRKEGTTSYSCFTVRDNNAGGLVFGDTTAALDDMATTNYASGEGGWHYYVGTFDSNTGIRCLYVDSVLVAQETNNVAYNLAPFAHLCIGAKDSSPGNTFGNYATAGMEIYDARVYNYAITQATITGLYGVIPAVINGQPKSVQEVGGRPATITATVGGTAPVKYQWLFNGASIQTLADATNYSGINTTALAILNMTTNEVGSYQLIASNVILSVTYTAVSSNAVITILNPYMVGNWFNGNASLAELSGYQPAGTHDGYTVGNTHYSFSSDVPPGKTGVSLYLSAGNTGISISNSSTLDASYTNTFDDTIHNAVTVTFWAKGIPGSWNPYVSKYGEGPGWQMRVNASASPRPTWTMRGTGGNEDMTSPSGTAQDGVTWHHYAGTYSLATGIRALYVDGKLLVSQTGQGAYNMAQAEHLCIGAKDSSPGNTFGNYFNGKIYDVRIYNFDLTSNQVAALAVIPNPAILGGTPTIPVTLYSGQATTYNVIESGGAPLTNQWQLNGVNLVDGTYNGTVVSGSMTTNLTIANFSSAFAGSIQVIVSNTNGAVTNVPVALNYAGQAYAPPPGHLVGSWFTGSSDLADHSGYSPAGTHDGYAVKNPNLASTDYVFTNNVPPSQSNGVSLWLKGGDTAIAISNSATSDAGYTNTYDDQLTNSFTLTFWAKGFPGAWTYFISKNGDSGTPNAGWTFRRDGWNSGNNPCWSVRSTGGTITLGDTAPPYGDTDDLGTATLNISATAWHHYAGTYNALTKIQNIYADGVLVAQKTNVGPYNLAAYSHVAIGAIEDSPGGAFTSFFTGQFFGVQIYNIELDANQINGFIQPPGAVLGQEPGPTPVFTGGNVGVTTGPNGPQFVLQWSGGTLNSSTNVAGPWTPVPGATSPYTNTIDPATPNLFFILSNP